MAEETGGESPNSTPATAGGNVAVGAEDVAAKLGNASDLPPSKHAAATAPGSTTTAPDESSAEQPRVDGAVDVESYEEIKARALAPAPTVPTLEESAAEHEAEFGGQSSEVSGESDSAEAATDVEPEPEEETKVPDRVRIGRLKDPVEKRRLATATQLAADEGISFAEAWERINPKSVAATDAVAVAVAVDATPLRSRAEIDADIKARKDAKRQAAGELDTVKMLDLDDEIETLRGELGQVAQAEAEAAAKNQSEFSRAALESQNKAARFYPDSAVKGSALYNKITEIADRLEASENPLIYQSDSPLKVAQMAANELGIAPADPNKPISKAAPATNGANGKLSPSTATKPAPVNQTAVSRSTQPAAAPASGAARTNHGNGSTGIAFENIKTIDDYEALKHSLGVGV